MIAEGILDTVLEPFTECLTPAAARKITEFRIDEATQERVSQLAAKANEGSLTDDERAEYQNFIEAFDLVAILKSRARRALKTS